ncbi:MAG: hypothetical protein JRI68_26845 [Deltaproteobacteria bacterium]|nr:hypothetical protein [Deltaproteobacteria bacterium]
MGLQDSRHAASAAGRARRQKPRAGLPGVCAAAGWVAALCGVAAGCSKADPPWTHQPDGAVVDESEPFLPGDRSGPWLGDASVGQSPAGDSGTKQAPVSRVGGLWVSCYGRFKPSGDPVKDVTRLGLMCGPVNGMTQQGDTIRGTVEPGTGRPGQPGVPILAGQFRVQAGNCYRIFAVAAPKVRDLDVTIRSSRGSRLTSDQTEDPWPIVDPERPFCSFEDDTFSIEVASGGAAGPFALQVWTLVGRSAGD